MKLRATISKYHSLYLCQISLQIMLLPILIESFYLQQLITDLITALEYEMQQNADRGQNAGNYPEL